MNGVMNEIILDVREIDEFRAEHVEHSIHVPLSTFGVAAPGLLNRLQGQNVLLLCQGGTRAALAAEQIKRLGYGDKVRASVVEGGIQGWRSQGKPTVSTGRVPLPVMRQVQLIAGLLVLTGTLLGALVNPWFLAVSGFVGAGLTLAGTTGFCGMARLLALMPWNVDSKS